MIGEITFLGFIWLIFVAYLFVMYAMLLINISIDLFGDKSTSGVSKAGWVLFLMAFPLIGILVYLVLRGGSMADRALARQKAAMDVADDYIRTVAGGPAGEIEAAKRLLDSGAITQAEFEALKAKSLA